MGKDLDVRQFPHHFLDLAYASDSKMQRLDVFLPDRGEGPYPLVIFVHGGGWISGGRREECISSVFKIVSQGYAIATVDYRLAPDWQWPAQIYDVKAAIRYLKANNKSLNLDTNKIVLWGNSAGAHIVSTVAATAYSAKLEDLTMGNPCIPCRIDGLINWYGSVDLATLDEDASRSSGTRVTLHTTTMNSTSCQLLGYVITDHPQKATAASALPYIDEHFVPTLIQHGKKDRVISYLQSVKFYEALCEHYDDKKVILELFENAEHGDPAFKTNQNINRCLDFLDSIYFAEGVRPVPRTRLPEIKLTESSTQIHDSFES